MKPMVAFSLASAAAKPLAKRKPNGTAINGYIHSPLPSVVNW
jgi:hypothetical protein